MKKIISSILVGTMLIGLFGTATVFADDSEKIENKVSITTAANTSENSASNQTNCKAEESILQKSLSKIKSFLKKNKSTIIKTEFYSSIICRLFYIFSGTYWGFIPASFFISAIDEIINIFFRYAISDDLGQTKEALAIYTILNITCSGKMLKDEIDYLRHFFNWPFA